MTLFSLLPIVAAIFAVLLAVVSLLRKKPSLATWCFFAGMAVLGIDSLVAGLEWADVFRAQTLGLIVKAFLPAAWLGFSLTYSRGDYRESLARWRMPLQLSRCCPSVYRSVSNNRSWSGSRQRQGVRCCALARSPRP